MNDKVIEVLRRARDVELPTRGWHQGNMVGPGGSVCALGAVEFARKELGLPLSVWQESKYAISRAVDASVPFWNDERCETVADVFDGFDLAIKRLEEQS